MSTLLDLIQTKVNYVVQEAIVVIRDIFRKYPNKYVKVVWRDLGTLVCQHQTSNLQLPQHSLLGL